MTEEQEKLDLAIRIALAEQHRNTRHDAIDEINKIVSVWADKYDFVLDDFRVKEITQAVMNLKQRKPELPNIPVL